MPSKPTRAATASGTRRKKADDRTVTALQHFRLIFKSVKKHFQWVEQQTGVNGAQLWALGVVVEQPGIKVSELAKALAIHQSTASNLVERLAQQELLRRERYGDDQRVVHLFAAPAGMRLVKKAPKPLQGVLPDALSRLAPADLATLDDLLGEVVRNMRVRDSAGRMTPLADI